MPKINGKIYVQQRNIPKDKKKNNNRRREKQIDFHLLTKNLTFCYVYEPIIFFFFFYFKQWNEQK